MLQGYASLRSRRVPGNSVTSYEVTKLRSYEVTKLRSYEVTRLNSVTFLSRICQHGVPGNSVTSYEVTKVTKLRSYEVTRLNSVTFLSRICQHGVPGNSVTSYEVTKVTKLRSYEVTSYSIAMKIPRFFKPSSWGYQTRQTSLIFVEERVYGLLPRVQCELLHRNPLEHCREPGTKNACEETDYRPS
ncbi:hypothetical protein AC249_AIPGENE21484 [Exaiptasia diaphana]|nr:hypothetical protein AC249_AIPGENE21484 [Exaiptasia diaphana]